VAVDVEPIVDLDLDLDLEGHLDEESSRAGGSTCKVNERVNDYVAVKLNVPGSTSTSTPGRCRVF
jgi:hypothetical protein